MKITPNLASAKSTKRVSADKKWAMAKKKKGAEPIGVNVNGVPQPDYDKKATAKIEKFLEEERWPGARELIRNELKKNPEDHWLWMMLGETYYEARKYETALKYAKKSLALAPECPMVLFHYAGTLAMLSRFKRALGAYQKILDREVESVAYDECGEGLDAAMQLMNDCHYRMGRCHTYLGDKKAAQVSFRKFLHNCAHGVRSIYDPKKAAALLAEVSH